MAIKVSSQDTVLNLEPEKTESWTWMSWADFLSLETKFYPFEFLFAKGFSFESIKKIYEEIN